jgi:hypothetical protein
MGNTFAIDLSEQVKQENLKLEIALEQHLQYNHYPPVPTVFIPSCKKAIELANDEKWDEELALPNGKTLTVTQIIEGLHLEWFVTFQEEG